MDYFLIAAAVLLIPYNLLSDSVCGALLSIIGCIFLFKNRAELKVNKYVFFSILILNIIAVISFMFCKDINLFFDGFFLYLNVFIFYLVFANLDNTKLLNAFVYITSICALVFIIFQALILNKRVDGNFSYANTYGLLLLIGLYINELKKKDKFYSIIQWMLIFGILFTESRNTFIYLIIFVAICYIMELRGKKEDKIIINFFTSILLYISIKYLGLGMIFVMPIFYIILYYIYSKLSFKIKNYMSILLVISLFSVFFIMLFTKSGPNVRINNITLSTGTFQERLIYYEDTAKHIMKNPLGSGINSFVYKQYKNQSAFYDVKYIHNSLLQICYDLGVLGLLPFLFIFAYSIFAILKFETGEAKIFKLILIVTIYLHSLLDFDFSFPTIFITVMMIINSSCKVRDLKIKNPFKFAVLGFTILIASYVCLINAFTLLGDAYVKKDMNKSLYLYKLNKDITFNNPDVYVSIAQIYNENNILQKCLDNLKLAQQINPDDPRIKTNIAFTYEKLGDTYNTIKYFDSVLEYQKYYPEIYKKYYFYLSSIYDKTKDYNYKIKIDDLKRIYYKNLKSLNKRALFLENQMNSNFNSIIKK